MDSTKTVFGDESWKKTGSAMYCVKKCINNDGDPSFSFITDLVVNNLQLL